ncbi:hypothetical protein Esti_004499 [Eimeria stiedai]
MVLHWRRKRGGLPLQLREQPARAGSSSSSSSPADVSSAPPAAAHPRRSILPVPRSLLLLSFLLLPLLGPSVTRAGTQQQQQQQHEEQQQQEQQQIMSPTLTENEPGASDDSTDASDALVSGDSAAVTKGEAIKAEKEMCAWMFDTLIAYFDGLPDPPPPPSIVVMHKRGVRTPAFVTWMKRRAGRQGFREEDVDLRGCIGSLDPIPILKLRDYALISALKDSRFHPVSRKEIADLKCHVSLLHSFEPGKDAYDWQIGKHGIVISFVANGVLGPRGYQATYLPEVAAETGMSHRDALISLVRKAGYHGGPVGASLFSSLSLTRYQSSQARLSYEEYEKRFKHSREQLGSSRAS